DRLAYGPGGCHGDFQNAVLIQAKRFQIAQQRVDFLGPPLTYQIGRQLVGQLLAVFSRAKQGINGSGKLAPAAHRRTPIPASARLISDSSFLASSLSSITASVASATSTSRSFSS